MVKPQFTIFIKGPEKEWWIWENNKYGSHSLTRICSGTTQTERWIQDIIHPGMLYLGFTVYTNIMFLDINNHPASFKTQCVSIFRWNLSHGHKQ
jgi:hypothetical protein